MPCLNFSAYEAVRLLEDSIFLGDVKLHHSALEKLADIIKRDESMGEYYSSELIKLAIEFESESILEATVITFREKLADYHVYKIIKQTIELDNNKVFEFVLDKLGDQIEGYAANKLILEFIEKKNIQLFQLLISTFASKLDSSDAYAVIKQAMELNDDKVFEFVLDKLSNNFNLDSSYYANKLMEELIDAKNTKLLNLATNQLINIIKSNASLGNYYLNKLLEKAIASQELQIIKFITSVVFNKISRLYGNEIIKYAIDINDGTLLEQIISICGETLDTWDISSLIDTAIKSDNIEYFNIVWDKFSEKELYGFKIIVSALKSKNEFKIDTVLKKYLTYHYSESEIKYLLKNLSQSPQNLISKEIKILFSKLLLKMKMVDFENLSHFSQDEILNAKDENGFPLSYHLFQKEVDIPARKLLDSIDINKYLPEGTNIFSRNSSYKHYVNREANKSIMIVTGEDHNGAFNYNYTPINTYLKKGVNITAIDHRNEKDLCLKNYLFDYYSYLLEQSIDLYFSDLLILQMHGGIGGKSGKHTVERDGMGVRTFEYLKDLTKNFEDTPLKVLLTACYGQKALADSIEILPNGSEMLTISEYRSKNNEIIKINNGREISNSYLANLSKRADLDASDILELDNIAYLYIKGYWPDKPSPSYAKKDKDGNIKMFSCIEKLEDLIEEKIDLSYVQSIQENFILKYCGNEDSECIDKSLSVIEKTLDSIKYMHMLNLSYRYHVEEVTEKLLDRVSDDFDVKLALGCHIGFSEISEDFVG